MKYSTFIVFMLVTCFCQAQDKIEFEKRIDVSAFPQTAYEQLQPYIKNVKRVKYYQESDGTSQSYEAKFKKFGYRYSVEFDAQGVLQDVEIRIPTSKLSTSTKKALTYYFNSQYERWKIEKIQQQFTSLQSLSKQPNPEVTSHLEIIVATKNAGKLVKYEYLFNDEQEVVSKRKIVHQSYDFLLF